MRRVLSMLMLAATAETATAQLTFSFDPAQPRAGQDIGLRFDDPSGCYPLPQLDVQRAGEMVTVKLHATDIAPCLPEWTTPQLVSLGAFPPGQYHVQAFVCSNPPPPLPACQLRATLPLTVLGHSATRQTVPMLSGAMAIGLAFLMAMVGVLSRGGASAIRPRPERIGSNRR